jgi:predicted RNase H-like nuclease (RuvC/YqgF family)
MNFEEFLTPKEESVSEEPVVSNEPEEPVVNEPEELDVQKVVVEELAADKAKLDEKVTELGDQVTNLSEKSKIFEKEIETLKEANHSLEKEKNDLLALLEKERQARAEAEKQLADALEKHFDEQSRNPNSLALLDRDIELPDRFPGETRDHVLEVVREARDKAEQEGRIRKAQILEGVLVANEPHGNLSKKRLALEKFFNDNANILSGPVIAELERCGISYKNGDEYLLTTEILRRTY